MSLLPVSEALARILDGIEPPAVQTVSIYNAEDRVLARDLEARFTQPPFDASAMDGYAVQAADIATVPATLTIIGEAAAGHPFHGTVHAGEAVRIFTGAPVPEGADTVVIQEDAERRDGTVIVKEAEPKGGNIRTRGFDFREGDVLLSPGTRLGPRELALAAAMGHRPIAVQRRPRVAILSTGDELVPPGARPGPGQIISSNHLGVGALCEAAGADVQHLGIARDTREDIVAHLGKAAGADVLVTCGGASVGDHDLVAPALEEQGLTLAFWKIALRPGKPMMFGRLGNSHVMGLPGNPVSSLICARIFLIPLVEALLGYTAPASHAQQARLAVPLDANGPRQHYMRAVSTPAGDGLSLVTPVRSQDSSLLLPLVEANCLLIRPPNTPAAAPGTLVSILPLDF
jgi:molybdopterin molybdotransferase